MTLRTSLTRHPFYRISKLKLLNNQNVEEIAKLKSDIKRLEDHAKRLETALERSGSTESGIEGI